MSRPLADVRVVALEQAVAMPFCSFILAEMGAEVIKIERRGSGDVLRGWDNVVHGLSTGYVAFNAGKRDLAVDLRHDAGRSIVQQLAATADVFLENFAPGVAQRLGLGADSLRAADERLVYCSLSGYGQTGPYRDVKAYDLLIQGESGVLLSNGYPDAPAKVGLPITDLVGGSTTALGVLGALRERDRTGRGTYLDVGMLEAMAPWLGYFPHHHWHAGVEPPRTGMRHQYLCPYGPYLAADGQYVNLVVASQEHWKIFVEKVMCCPHWLDDPRFVNIEARKAHRDELEHEVEQTIATQPAEVWFGRLRDASLPYGEVRDMASVVSHPQIEHRRTFVEGSSPVGPLPLVRFPLADPDAPRHVPDLGEHTEDILRNDLGYDDEQIAQLREAGVI